MLKLIKTSSDNPHFVALTKLLDKELLGEYGNEVQSYYDQFNTVTNIKHVIVAYNDDIAVGCGAVKPYDDDTMEVKRMYVKDEFRGQQIAKTILENLQASAKEEGFSYCILETGTKQQLAIALYTKMGYDIIPNYGQYVGMETSICMQKKLV